MLISRSRFPLVSALFCLTLTAGRAGDFSAEQLHAFENKVRPLLAEHCYACHGPEKQNNGLRLDSRASLLRALHSRLENL